MLLHKLVVALRRTPHPSASPPFLTFIIYLTPASDLNALITVPLTPGDVWQLDALGLPMHAIFLTNTFCYLL